MEKPQTAAGTFLNNYLKQCAIDERKDKKTHIVFINKYTAELKVISKYKYDRTLRRSLYDVFKSDKAYVEKEFFHLSWEEIGVL